LAKEETEGTEGFARLWRSAARRFSKRVSVKGHCLVRRPFLRSIGYAFAAAEGKSPAAFIIKPSKQNQARIDAASQNRLA